MKEDGWWRDRKRARKRMGDVREGRGGKERAWLMDCSTVERA